MSITLSAWCHTLRFNAVTLRPWAPNVGSITDSLEFIMRAHNWLEGMRKAHGRQLREVEDAFHTVSHY